MIDLLASEYGWAKDDILEKVYFDDLYHLSRQISKRQLAEQMLQLAIAQNPHSKNPEALWKEFEQKERELSGKTYLDAEFDEKGFMGLKAMLKRQGGGIDIK